MTTCRSIALSTAVSIAAGLPLYLLLDHLRWLPLALRDQPWPLEVVALGAAFVTVALTWRALRAGRGRAVAIPCAVLALASAIALPLYARRLRHQLPPPPAGLAIGSEVDFTLPDDTGKLVRVASLRGHPVLLYFYRGGW